jgi:hypothetical protein
MQKRNSAVGNLKIEVLGRSRKRKVTPTTSCISL